MSYFTFIARQLQKYQTSYKMKRKENRSYKNFVWPPEFDDQQLKCLLSLTVCWKNECFRHFCVLCSWKAPLNFPNIIVWKQLLFHNSSAFSLDQMRPLLCNTMTIKRSGFISRRMSFRYDVCVCVLGQFYFLWFIRTDSPAG